MDRGIGGRTIVETAVTQGPIRRGRGSTILVATLALAIALVVGTPAGASAAAPFTWSGVTAVPVQPPANADSEPEAFFDWGACATAGSCVGIGSYTDEDGNEQALAATRTGGSWGQASEIVAPANAAGNPEVAFGVAQAVVACPAAGACVAVGSYTDSSDHRQVMATEQTGGVWGQAIEIEPPANAASDPQARVRSVACATSSACVAGGNYVNEDGEREAMVVVETSGSWGTASELELPANARSFPFASIKSVACPAAGPCVAFGEYQDEATGTEEAMVATETGGTWGQASQIALPAHAGSEPRSTLNSVACIASGPCIAVGKYTDENEDREAMVATETGGLWGQADEIASPANAATDPKVEFSSISHAGSIACPALGSCVIAGVYEDSAGATEAMSAEETGGVWDQASEIAPPANAASGNPKADEARVACAGAGVCVVIGSYKQEGGGTEAMVAEETGGIWGQASEIAPPANAAGNPGVIFGPIYCFASSSSSSCVGFGEYTNSVGKTEGMEIAGVKASELPKEGEEKRREEEAAAAKKRGEEAAAAKKRGEEEAAAKKRQEEEAALAKKHAEEAKGALTGSVSLVGSKIGIQSGGKGSVRLACTGTATCTGRLTLTVKAKAKGSRKAKVKTIGAGAFSIPAGKTVSVTLTLTAAGRALLKAGHGKLGYASLTILKSSPSPTSTQHKRVQLVQQRPPKRRK